MSTEFIWVVPAYYVTDKSDPLRFDLTEQARVIASAQGDIAEADIVSAEVAVTSLYTDSSMGSRSLSSIGYFGDLDRLSAYSKESIAGANLDCGHNLIGFKTVFTFESSIPPRMRATVAEGAWEFMKPYGRMLKLTRDMAGVFRAATHLTFASDYAIMPGMEHLDLHGGVVFVQSQGKDLFETSRACEHTFPAIFMEDHRPSFDEALRLVSEAWHLELWPLRRFLRALHSEWVQMDNLLDLMFAIEGLFPKDTPAPFIKVFSAVAVGGSYAGAVRTENLLSVAFRIRNEIVHGAKEYSGMEQEFKIGGKKVLSQEVFWRVRRVAAQLLFLALRKRSRNEGMRKLAFNIGDLIEMFYIEKALSSSTAEAAAGVSDDP